MHPARLASETRSGRSRRLRGHRVTLPMPGPRPELSRAERLRARGSHRELPIRNGRPLVPQASSTHRSRRAPRRDTSPRPQRALVVGCGDSPYLIHGRPGFLRSRFKVITSRSQHMRARRPAQPRDATQGIQYSGSQDAAGVRRVGSRHLRRMMHSVAGCARIAWSIHVISMARAHSARDCRPPRGGEISISGVPRRRDAIVAAAPILPLEPNGSSDPRKEACHGRKR
jgi:hypothetical protein